jgi:hypothetical protein
MAITITSCAATGEIAMFETCEMKLEPLSKVQKGPLLLEVIASRQMCIVPDDQLDPWPYAAFLRVTNTGATPVKINYGEGTLGDRAFSMEQVTEQLPGRELSRAEGSDSGPVDMSSGSIEEQILAPGASQKVVGDPKYILRLIKHTVNGDSLSGTAVPDEVRWSRKFQIEFAYWVKSNDTDITGTLSAPLEVVVKQPDE